MLSRVLLYCLFIFYASCSAMNWDTLKSSEYFASYCLIGGILTGLSAYTLYNKYMNNTWWWKYYPPVFADSLEGSVRKTRHDQERNWRGENVNAYDFSKYDSEIYLFIQYAVSPQHDNQCGYDAFLNSLIILIQVLPNHKEHQCSIIDYFNHYTGNTVTSQPLSIQELIEDNNLRDKLFRAQNQSPWVELSKNNYVLIAKHLVDTMSFNQLTIDLLDFYAQSTGAKIEQLKKASILDGSALLFLVDSCLKNFPSLHNVVTFYMIAQNNDLEKQIPTIYPNQDDHNKNNYLSKTINDLKRALQDDKVGIVLMNIKSHWISIVIKKENNKYIIVGADSINKPMLSCYTYINTFIDELIKN